MFFIARMTAAMLIWFCGSNNTTCTCDRTDSGISNSERKVAVLRKPIATKIHEPTVVFGEHELAAAALSIRGCLVHGDAEQECCTGSEVRCAWNGRDDRVAGRRPTPRGAERRRFATHGARAH